MGACQSAATLDERDWHQIATTRNVIRQLPVIALLRPDMANETCPHIMTDSVIKNDTNSKLYRMHPITIKGLDYAAVVAGKPLSQNQLDGLDEALSEARRLGAEAIVGDTGALVHYQSVVAQRTKLPVMLSPLLQAPLLDSVIPPNEYILVITKDSKEFGHDALQRILRGGSNALLHEQSSAHRFILRGLESSARLMSESKQGSRIELERELCQIVGELNMELITVKKRLGAIIFDCAIQPQLVDAVRARFNLPCADNLTLADFGLKACTSHQRFGLGSVIEENSVMAKLHQPERKTPNPSIGVLRIDYTYPPALGDADHPSSYNYDVTFATWKRFTFDAARAANRLDDRERAAMKKAITALEKQGVMGVAGDCGFLMHYQEEARQACTVPCFVSPLLHCSVLSCMFALDEYILVLTADGPALMPHMPKLLSLCHVTNPSHQARFLVRGCERLPGFEAVFQGKAVDVNKVRPHIVRLVEQEIAREPRIRAVLFECTELPPYADAVRAATGLPVFDVITIADYFHSALSSKPHRDIDWSKIEGSRPLSRSSTRSLSKQLVKP